MAFYGSLGEVNFDNLDASIVDTAVDVFVYDTRKDSDGGAWRKRTQHTSWYNETLNTGFRGSRREFPAVAVIVTTNSGDNGQVIIYDGDDPDMPMWMKFNVGYNSPNRKMIGVNSAENLTSSSMINAKLVTGTRDGASDDGGVYIIDFIKDNRLLYQVGGYFGPHILNEIANRNVSTTSRGTQFGPIIRIVNPDINDVAMTVLPNAPIDDATGLPIPTIAVATDGGVSVIKDDGTVYDIIDSNGLRKCYDISFTKHHRIMFTGDLGAGGTSAGNVFVVNIPSGDLSEYDNNASLYRWYSTFVNYPRINGGDTFNTRVLYPIDVDGDCYAMADVGVSLIEPVTSTSVSNNNDMVTYVTSDYNTGWMHGDIKGAFLSDTDATNVTGTELVTNGTFDTDISGWTAYNSVISVDSNRLRVDDTANAGGWSSAVQEISTEIGKQYILQFTFTSSFDTGLAGHYAGSYASAGAGTQPTQHSDYGTTSGTYTRYITATTTITSIIFAVNNQGVAFFDNISLKLAEEDRSVNAKGLQVFGTVTKSPVAGSGATAAELVAYSGFSSPSNYFQQPAENLSIGTGDFSFLCWGKGIRNYETFLAYGNNSSNSGNLIIQTGGTTDGRDFRVYINGVGNNSSLGPLSYTTGWNLYSVVRRNGILYYYHNATLIDSDSAGGSIGNSTSTLRIGGAGNAAAAQGIGDDALDQGFISLLRLSDSAISEDQLSKIYEDEKVLFQENAACTLYGSSDAVTALAYDEDTDLLHVGTSSGRSDFQGLRRINNTTTAVTTAISASDGLIVEQ